MIVVNKSVQLEAEKKTRQTQVDQQYESIILAGLNFQGNVFQIDEGSQGNMQATMLGFAIGQTQPSGGFWRSLANVNVAMDDATLKSMILAAQSYVKAALFNSWTLKDQIGQLTTIAAVQAFDITQGWPANNG